MKKTTFKLAILLFLLVFQQVATAQNNIIDEVIWTVGEEFILKSDVENQKLAMQAQGQQISGDPNCMIPEQIAVQKLFLHQAKLDSIVVTESEIRNAVDFQINYWKSQVGSLEKLEEYQKKSLAQIRNEAYEPAKNELLTRRVQSQLTESVKITPADVRNYFKKLKPDSIPTIPETVEIQIITANPAIPQKEIDRTKQRLREFTDRINSGEAQFSTLARLYSEDPGSAVRGGELGFKGRAEFDPEFANVAFALTDTKKISRVVESQYGFHIIQLIEKRGEQANFRHILLKPQVSLDAENAAIQRLDSMLTFIRSGKSTFDELAKYSFDADTRMNNGLMTNARTGTARFELRELPSEIVLLANKMSVGEMSKPFTMMNEKTNRKICAIIKIKEKNPAHKANLKDDYQFLKTTLEDQQRSDVIVNWILKKQKETYVNIDPKWRNCKFQYPNWGKQ